MEVVAQRAPVAERNVRLASVEITDLELDRRQIGMLIAVDLDRRVDRRAGATRGVGKGRVFIALRGGRGPKKGAPEVSKRPSEVPPGAVFCERHFGEGRADSTLDRKSAVGAIPVGRGVHHNLLAAHQPGRR